MSLFKGAPRSLVRAAACSSRQVCARRAASSMTAESQQKVMYNGILPGRPMLTEIFYPASRCRSRTCRPRHLQDPPKCTIYPRLRGVALSRVLAYTKRQEKRRQKHFINLIPSENFTSQAVLDALGSVMQSMLPEIVLEVG